MVRRDGNRAAFLTVFLAAAPAGATDYYLSPTGNDGNVGTQAAPWQTLAKANLQSFAAGDRLWLEGGQSFAGELDFEADDTGTAADPIRVGSYGTGRATIAAGTGSAITIYNTAGIEIRDLVLRGGWNAVTQSGNDDNGIDIYMDLPGVTRLDHLRIENVDVSGFKISGITMGAWADDGSMSGFRDVAIRDCIAHDNGDAGIDSWGMWDPASSDYSHRDIVVEHCVVHHNRGISGKGTHSGNGIVLSGVDGARIERCLAHDNGDLCDHRGGGPVGIWAWDAKNVVIRHNESHHNRTGAVSGDGGGFDIDGGVSYSTVEYNYSHDNDGAGFLIYQFFGARPLLGFNTVRYNVSENDGREHGYSGIFIGGGVEVHDNVIHNNTVFISPGASAGVAAVIFVEVGANNGFFNNLLMTTGGVRLIDADFAYVPTDVLFQGNDYWVGSNPADFHILWGAQSFSDLATWRGTGQEMDGATSTGFTVDPGVEAPGNGGTIDDPDTLSSLTAYRLLASSPLLDVGIDLQARHGIAPGPEDFWGTSLPVGAGYEVGAFEGIGCAVPTPGNIGNTLWLARVLPDVQFRWQDVLDATSFLVYADSAASGSFPTVAGSAISGSPGPVLPLAPEPLRFYRVAGSNSCGEGRK